MGEQMIAIQIGQILESKFGREVSDSVGRIRKFEKRQIKNHAPKVKEAIERVQEHYKQLQVAIQNNNNQRIAELSHEATTFLPTDVALIFPDYPAKTEPAPAPKLPAGPPAATSAGTPRETEEKSHDGAALEQGETGLEKKEAEAVHDVEAKIAAGLFADIKECRKLLAHAINDGVRVSPKQKPEFVVNIACAWYAGRGKKNLPDALALQLAKNAQEHFIKFIASRKEQLQTAFGDEAALEVLAEAADEAEAQGETAVLAEYLNKNGKTKNELVYNARLVHAWLYEGYKGRLPEAQQLAAAAQAAYEKAAAASAPTPIDRDWNPDSPEERAYTAVADELAELHELYYGNGDKKGLKETTTNTELFVELDRLFGEADSLNEQIDRDPQKRLAALIQITAELGKLTRQIKEKMPGKKENRADRANDKIRGELITTVEVYLAAGSAKLVEQARAWLSAAKIELGKMGRPDLVALGCKLYAEQKGMAPEAARRFGADSRIEFLRCRAEEFKGVDALTIAQETIEDLDRESAQSSAVPRDTNPAGIVERGALRFVKAYLRYKNKEAQDFAIAARRAYETNYPTPVVDVAQKEPRTEGSAADRKEGAKSSVDLIEAQISINEALLDRRARQFISPQTDKEPYRNPARTVYEGRLARAMLGGAHKRKAEGLADQALDSFKGLVSGRIRELKGNDPARILETAKEIIAEIAEIIAAGKEYKFPVPVGQIIEFEPVDELSIVQYAKYLHALFYEGEDARSIDERVAAVGRNYLEKGGGRRQAGSSSAAEPGPARSELVEPKVEVKPSLPAPREAKSKTELPPELIDEALVNKIGEIKQEIEDGQMGKAWVARMIPELNAKYGARIKIGLEKESPPFAAGTACFWYARGNGVPEAEANKLAGRAEQRVIEERLLGFSLDPVAAGKLMLEEARLQGRKFDDTETDLDIIGLGRFFFAQIYEGKEKEECKRLSGEARRAYEKAGGGGDVELSDEELDRRALARLGGAPGGRSRAGLSDTESDVFAAAKAASGADTMNAGNVSTHYTDTLRQDLRSGAEQYVGNLAADLRTVRERTDMRRIDKPENPAEAEKIRRIAVLEKNHYGRLLGEIKNFSFTIQPRNTMRAGELNRVMFIYFNGRYEKEVLPLVKELQAVDPASTGEINRLENQIKTAIGSIDKKLVEARGLDSVQPLPPEYGGQANIPETPAAPEKEAILVKAAPVTPDRVETQAAPEQSAADYELLQRHFAELLQKYQAYYREVGKLSALLEAAQKTSDYPKVEIINEIMEDFGIASGGANFEQAKEINTELVRLGQALTKVESTAIAGGFQFTDKDFAAKERLVAGFEANLNDLSPLVDHWRTARKAVDQAEMDHKRLADEAFQRLLRGDNDEELPELDPGLVIKTEDVSDDQVLSKRVLAVSAGEPGPPSTGSQMNSPDELNLPTRPELFSLSDTTVPAPRQGLLRRVSKRYDDFMKGLRE